MLGPVDSSSRDRSSRKRSARARIGHRAVRRRPAAAPNSTSESRPSTQRAGRVTSAPEGLRRAAERGPVAGVGRITASRFRGFGRFHRPSGRARRPSAAQIGPDVVQGRQGSLRGTHGRRSPARASEKRGAADGLRGGLRAGANLTLAWGNLAVVEHCRRSGSSCGPSPSRSGVYTHVPQTTTRSPTTTT